MKQAWLNRLLIHISDFKLSLTVHGDLTWARALRNDFGGNQFKHIHLDMKILKIKGLIKIKSFHGVGVTKALQYAVTRGKCTFNWIRHKLLIWEALLFSES